jgi:hypothetical protein
MKSQFWVYSHGLVSFCSSETKHKEEECQTQSCLLGGVKWRSEGRETVVDFSSGGDSSCALATNESRTLIYSVLFVLATRLREQRLQTWKKYAVWMFSVL